MSSSTLEVSSMTIYMNKIPLELNSKTLDMSSSALEVSSMTIDMNKIPLELSSMKEIIPH